MPGPPTLDGHIFPGVRRRVWVVSADMERLPPLLWVLEQVVAGKLSDISDVALAAARDTAMSLDLFHARQILNVEMRRRNAVAAGDPDAHRWVCVVPGAPGTWAPDTGPVSRLFCAPLETQDKSLTGVEGFDLATVRDHVLTLLGKVDGELSRLRGGGL